MGRFIDDHRDVSGVEPICRMIPIASSTYHGLKCRGSDPSLRLLRAKRDAELKSHIRRVRETNLRVCYAAKAWRKLNRGGIPVAPYTIECLMHNLGLEGTVRRRSCGTRVPADQADCPMDLVDRDFAAGRPQQLWVSHLTQVATWRGSVQAAFCITSSSFRIVGWWASNPLRSDGALAALDQRCWK